MVLLNQAQAIYVGGTPAQKVYLGGTLVWSAEFRPDSIPGLVAWIDAAEVPLVDGAPVSTLIDLTGRRFDASAYLNPSPSPPVMRATAASGQPGIEFQGQSGLTAMGAFLGTAGLTFVAVGRILATPAYAMLVTRGSNVSGAYSGHTYEMRLSDTTTALQCIGDYTLGGPVWSSTYLHTLGVDYLDWMEWEPGVASRLYVNGVDRGAGSAIALIDEGGDISVGCRMDGYYWNGLVREVLVYNRVLTTDERQQVHTHLMGKYLLSLG